MAVGKNKRLTKGGGKKGNKKKAGDPFLKKEWYDIKAPSLFSVRNCGKTLVTKTQGTKIATEELKGRVLEVNLADLNNDEDQAYKKIKLCIEEVQGRSCLTDFHGMSLTRDKECSLIRKWQTLIEAHTDVKTSDGYVVRMFVIAFTKRRPDQVKSNCYAQSAQIRRIRKKMVDVMIAEAGKVQLRPPRRERRGPRPPRKRVEEESMLNPPDIRTSKSQTSIISGQSGRERTDTHGNPIQRGSKNHRCSFRDEGENRQCLHDVKEVTAYKAPYFGNEYRDDDKPGCGCALM